MGTKGREELRAKRRGTVLEAALAVIADRGLADTRMRDIAARAGMSPGHLFYYFDSKSDLLVHALRWSEDRLMARAVAELARLSRAADRLVRLVELAAPKGVADAGWVLWLEVWSLAPHDPPLALAEGVLDRRWMQALADVVAEGQAVGEFDRDVDGVAFAQRLSALIDGLGIQVVGGVPGMAERRLREIVLEVAGRELGCELQPVHLTG